MFRSDQMAIYIHWPFCAAKCPYCDFNSHVREGGLDHARWSAAYIKAIRYYAQILPRRQVVSVFFGGGTPSLMEPKTVQEILDEIQKCWPVVNDLEVTLEANPTSVEAEKFQAFRSAGVNRVSLGVQALNNEHLTFLGRQHSVAEALRAIEIAGTYFDRYSFDLIYARPNQPLKAWEDELKTALQYARGHVSLYQLTIERNTPFYMQYKRGAFQIPDDVMGAEFYHLTQDVLEAAGLPAYEISNHSAAGQECRHNLVYWHYGDYIGIGAGAHGRFVRDGQKFAVRDHSAPEVWLERVEAAGHGGHAPEMIGAQDRFTESLMMGLRLRGGISIRHIEENSGCNFKENIHETHLARAISEGWVEMKDDYMALTREGLLRLNALIPYLL